MVRALVVVRDDARDYGVWDLAALPVAGHVLVIGVDDRPAYLRVVNVFHIPVPSPAADGALPYVAIGVEPYVPPAGSAPFGT